MSSRTSVPDDPLDGIIGAFPCVRIQGLPFQATVGDLIQFFAGMTIIDVIFILKDKRTTGEAFIMFSDSKTMEAALGKHKQYIGERYVEIFRASRSDYYFAGAKRFEDERRDARTTSRSAERSWEESRRHSRPIGATLDDRGYETVSYRAEHHDQYPSPSAGAKRPRYDDELGASESFPVKMRGLPYSATVEDIMDFLRGSLLVFYLVFVLFPKKS
jgi:hypothetical protein